MRSLFLSLLLAWGVSGAQESALQDYQEQLSGNPFINAEGQFLYNENLLDLAAMGGGSTVGNGGDAIYCEGEQGDQFWGYYALDYLLTYVKSNNNGDIVPVTSWEQSRDRILKQLQQKAPLLASQFEQFIAGMDNFVDYSAPIIWQEAPFGLVDLKDENMMRLLPENCYQENKPLLFQMIRRVQHDDNFVVFEFDSDFYQLFRYVRPLQFSMIMLHEFAWSYTADVNKVRQFVRMMHSKQLEGYSVESFNRVLRHLNFDSLRQEGTPLTAYSERFVDQIKKGNFELAKEWIQAGVDVNLPSEDGNWTALMYVAGDGEIEMVKELLQYGAYVNTVNDNGCTALMFAVENQHLEIVKLLLQFEANVNIVTKDGSSALISAASRGNLEILNLLIDAGAELDVQCEGGWTALHGAIRNGYFEVAKRLIQLGANVNLGHGGLSTSNLARVVDEATFDGKIGYSSEQLELVSLLLEAGASIENSLVERYHLYPILYFGGADLARLLLEAGADPNTLPIKGGDFLAPGSIVSVLSEAAEDGNKEKVRLLLTYGADPNIKGDDQSTALSRVVEKGDVEMAQTLITAGADPNVVILGAHGNEYPLLSYAAKEGNVDMVKLLIGAKANLNELIKVNSYQQYLKFYNYSALSYAARGGHVEVARMLLEAGANPDVGAPLMIAAGKEEIEIVQLLLTMKADVNLTGVNGKTALMIAAQEGSLQALKLLLEVGADKNIRDLFRKKAYDYAKKYWDVSIRNEMTSLLFWWW